MMGGNVFHGVSYDDSEIIAYKDASPSFSQPFGGLFVTYVERGASISGSSFDSSGNFIITIEGKTEGTKVMHTSDLNSAFKEVPTATKQGNNQLRIPASAPELQGPKGFFRVKAE